MINYLKSQLEESIEVKKKIINDENLGKIIIKVANIIIDAYRNNKKILVFGNGGSAADAQHFVAELVNKFRFDRRALAAIALTSNTSVLTAISNDDEYGNVFARQVEALAQNGDIVIGISTSGNSKNLSKAFDVSKNKGSTSVALLGKDGGENKNYSDLNIIVPSYDTPRIQEAHITIIHIICDIIEGTLFGGNNGKSSLS